MRGRGQGVAALRQRRRQPSQALRAKPRKEDSTMTLTATPDLRRWQEYFVAEFLPLLYWRACRFFWRRNRSGREEVTQNAIALCWRAYLRCRQLDKPILNTTLVRFAIWDAAKGQTVMALDKRGKAQDVFRRTGHAGISVPRRTITLSLFGVDFQAEDPR